ncbi:MAG: DUF4912 domain-containing protein [bacterium]|nr:DUF4912 domain-containing protein [bacterium]
MNEKNKKSTPEIVKILWYRHKVDKWPIKKIAEVYNISKSTIYRWFKSLKEEEINEDYIKFDVDRMNSEFFTDYLYFGENILSREYFKSSFEVQPKDEVVKIDELPGRYGFNYSFALPIDPYRIFVYWEISEQYVDNPEITIKVFDGTDDEILLHMILTSKYLVSNMYIPVGIPDRVYFAEIYTKEGNKFLLRTNKVRTPRNSPSSIEIMSMYDWYNIDQTMFSISSFIINKL